MDHRPSVTIVDDVARAVSEDDQQQQQQPQEHRGGMGGGAAGRAAAPQKPAPQKPAPKQPAAAVVMYEIYEETTDSRSAKAPTFAFADRFDGLDFYNRLHYEDMQAYGPSTWDEVRCYFVLGALLLVSLASLVIFEPVKYWQGIQVTPVPPAHARCLPRALPPSLTHALTRSPSRSTTCSGCARPSWCASCTSCRWPAGTTWCAATSRWGTRGSSSTCSSTRCRC